MTNTKECPCCYAVFTKEESLLGNMGDLVHYRCPYCGANFHNSVDDEQLEEGDTDEQ